MRDGIITDAMARHESLMALRDSQAYGLLVSRWHEEESAAFAALLHADAANVSQVARVQTECNVLLRVINTLTRLIEDARAEFEREGESV